MIRQLQSNRGRQRTAAEPAAGCWCMRQRASFLGGGLRDLCRKSRLLSPASPSRDPANHNHGRLNIRKVG